MRGKAWNQDYVGPRPSRYHPDSIGDVLISRAARIATWPRVARYQTYERTGSEKKRSTVHVVPLSQAAIDPAKAAMTLDAQRNNSVLMLAAITVSNPAGAGGCPSTNFCTEAGNDMSTASIALRFNNAPVVGVVAGLILFISIAGYARGQAVEVRPTGFPVTCAPGEVEVMLLGTYHFANPGRDVIKQDFDDVLQPRRQAEIEDVARRLARWQPDRIAVEWPWSFMDSTAARYARHRAGTLAPSRNEVVQLGFRIAASLGHPAVYPIDDDSFLDSNDSLRALDRRRPELKRARDSIVSVLQASANSVNAWMRQTSIVEHLRRLNADDALHSGNSLGMFGGYLAAGEGGNYGGPQFLAKWYERNFNMAHNLTRITTPGVRRILVIVGAGHVPPLRNILDEAPQFCPVSPLPYLR